MDHSLCEEEALCNKVGTAGARLCLCNIGAPTEGGICLRTITPCEGASCLHLWKPAGGTTEVSNIQIMCYIQQRAAISWGLQSAENCQSAESCDQLGTHKADVQGKARQGKARHGRTAR